MNVITDPVDRALLDDFQHGFPLVPRPFGTLAETLGITEGDVIARLRARREAGQITRIGATCAPNTISASTLAAVAAPEDRIAQAARIIGEEPGVNHSYLRENRWNLWFVATGPDRAHVDAALRRIARRSGLRVLDLRLVRAFNLDLGFSLRGGRRRAAPAAVPDMPDVSVLEEGDRALMQALMRGLALVPEPYGEIADRLGRDRGACEVIERIRRLSEARIISRFGVIVRHRALGWRSNAMVVWDLPHEAITRAGPALAAAPGVTLCYERRPVPGVWPYRLYSMIHARSRAEALDRLEAAAAMPELRGVPHLALFSSHCFKQTGAMVAETDDEERRRA